MQPTLLLGMKASFLNFDLPTPRLYALSSEAIAKDEGKLLIFNF